MREKNGGIGKSKVYFDTLEEWVRMKAQEFLQSVMEEEVTERLGRQKNERRDPGGIDRSDGDRNGFGKCRRLGMMNGTIEVRRPRIRGLEERFESTVLPLFKRRTKEVGNMLPDLYLHGLASGDFELARRGLLGDGAPLSASSIQRLKGKWELEYEAWKKRDLSGLEVVYWWADGLYVKAGIEDRKTALLTIVAGLSDGQKVQLVMESGERESKESWLKILRDLRARGLKFPRRTIADGAWGLWAALGEIHPEGDEQRCWNHKIVNVLDDLNKRDHAVALELLKDMPYADTEKECEKIRDQFLLRCKKQAPKAVETLQRDWERMVTFYSYPKAHWQHIRTTNIVESPFSAIRLRTNASRRFKKVASAKAMIWKLMTVAEQNWRKLNAPELCTELYDGTVFKDGETVIVVKSPEAIAA